MKIEDIIRRYKKKIERKTEAMNDYKQSNNIELLTAVSVCENEIEEAELIISALELSKAKEEGRLVVLPCKVGDTVFTTRWWDDVKEKCTDSKGKPFFRTIRQHKVTKEVFSPFGLDYIEWGKTVFLTREAAEKALSPICNTTKLPCAECNPVCEHRKGE